MEKGFWAVPKSIAKRKDLSLKAKLIAGILWSMKSSNSEVFPSRNYLADTLSVSVETIDRGLKELKEKAGIKAKRRGFGKSNCYLIPDWLESSRMITPEGTEVTTHEEAGLKSTKGSRVTTIIDDVNKYTNVDDQKSSQVKEIFSYFRCKVKETRGFDPEINWAKDGKLTKLRLRKYPKEEIQKLIDWYLSSNFSERLGVSLATCLSTYVINLFKSEMASKPFYPFWKPPRT